MWHGETESKSVKGQLKNSQERGLAKDSQDLPKNKSPRKQNNVEEEMLSMPWESLTEMGETVHGPTKAEMQTFLCMCDKIPEHCSKVSLKSRQMWKITC